MNRADGFYRLELDDDGIFNQQVDAVTGIDPQSVVLDRQCQLAMKADPPLLQLIGETGFVSDSSSPGPSCEWTRIAPSMICPVISLISTTLGLRALCGECVYPTPTFT